MGEYVVRVDKHVVVVAASTPSGATLQLFPVTVSTSLGLSQAFVVVFSGRADADEAAFAMARVTGSILLSVTADSVGAASVTRYASVAADHETVAMSAAAVAVVKAVASWDESCPFAVAVGQAAFEVHVVFARTAWHAQVSQRAA